MFSDTHFHFKMMVTQRALDGSNILSELVNNKCFFGLDIGTSAQDLSSRVDCVEKSIQKIKNQEIQKKANNLIHYSSGIWPNIQEIKDRFNALKNLEDSINDAEKKGIKICAIGEAGLDHHWNPSGADGRCEQDFNSEIYQGEKELFMMQLELAKKKNLPMIVHSRDAFIDSLECIKNVGYNNGIIHCFSYGIQEARAFLDLGWYIAFGGGTTYTKKSKMEQMEELLKFIPEDRILCETDSPYLAPVPHRGESNSPLLINYVYEFIANIRGVSKEYLSEVVDTNIKKLFNLKEEC